MRLLQINCVFAVGSTGKIVYAIHEYAKTKGDEPFAIYGTGKKSTEPNVFRATPWVVRKVQSFRSRITGYAYGGCIWGTANAIRIIDKVKPDIVHVHCMNAYIVNIYRILEHLKKNHIPTVLTNHAEFMYTGGCIYAVDCNKWITGCHNCDKINKEHPISYFFDRTPREWELMREASQGFDKMVVCCVSDWVRDRASQSLFYKQYPVVTVLNGLDTDVFHYTNAEDIKAKLNLKGKVVVHVTADLYRPIKGGQHVLEMAKRFPDVNFVILGSEAKDDTAPRNCRFMGMINDQNLLAQYYSMGDVCLLTSVRETYSMVCAESLCCGTVVVGFMSGGPETISLPEYSCFVEQGNDDKLEFALRKMLDNTYDKKAISEVAMKTYGQDTMCKNYYEVYRELLK